jgi:Mg2+/Co2+ transporter CorC
MKGNFMVKPVKKLELTNNPYDKHFDSEDLLTISQIIAQTLGDDADNWHGSWSINVELHYD